MIRTPRNRIATQKSAEQQLMIEQLKRQKQVRESLKQIRRVQRVVNQKQKDERKIKDIQLELFKNLYEWQKYKLKSIIIKINTNINFINSRQQNIVKNNIIQSVITTRDTKLINRNFPLYVIEQTSEMVENYFLDKFNSILSELFSFFSINRNTTITEIGVNAIRLFESINISAFFNGTSSVQNKRINDTRIKFFNFINRNLLQEIIIPIEYTNDQITNFAPIGDQPINVIVNKRKYYALLFMKYEPQTGGFSTIDIKILLPQYIIGVYNFKENIEKFINSIFNIPNIRMSASLINKIDDIIPSSNSVFNNTVEESILHQDHFSFAWCILFFQMYLFLRYKLGFDFENSILRTMAKQINDIKKDPDLKLSIIKSYIYYLKNINLITIDLYYFNYFWSVKNELCVIKSYPKKYKDKKERDKDITLQKSSNIISLFGNFKLYSNVNNNLIDIYFNNIYQNYRISENLFIKRILMKIMSHEYISENIIFENDNIIKFFYLFLEFIKNNEGVDPDKIYNEFYINNDENVRDFNATSDNKKDFYDKLYLKEYLINHDPRRFLSKVKSKIIPLNYEYVSDTDIQLGVNLRNQDYRIATGTYGNTCTYPSSLQSYQKAALKVMLDKIRSNIPGEPKGLLMWYGTGSGKTFAASTIAKMVGFCTVPKYNFIQNIIIISPISAFMNFRKELANQDRELGVFLNKFPLNEEKPSENYYFVGDNNSHIFLFTHTSFEKVIKNPNTNLVSNNNIKFNKTFLNNSLLIIDECHNFASPNVDNPTSKKTTELMIDCCKKARNVLLLTATPMQNSIFEIENILAMTDGRDVSRDNLKYLRRDFSYINPTMTIRNVPTIINENNIVSNFRTNKIWEFDTNTIYNSTLRSEDPQPVRNQLFNNMFSNRIIEYSDISRLPRYIECIYFVNLNTILENELISRLKRDGLENRANIEARTRNSFGSLENKFVFANNIKQGAILDLIMRRENTDPVDKLSNFNKPSIYDFKNNLVKYKYIIFCSKIENLQSVRNLLVASGISNNLIGEIRGGMSTDDRKNNVEKYERGIIKFMLITQAGEEGVDFKRTALIILADFVYTPSEYQQILGRAIRLNSNLPDPNDSKTLIPKIIECYSIINTFVGNHFYTRNAKQVPIYSYEVLSLKVLLEKRAEIDKFTKDIGLIFYSNTSGLPQSGLVQSPSTKKILKKSRKTSRRKRVSRSKKTSRRKRVSHSKKTSRRKRVSRNKKTSRRKRVSKKTSRRKRVSRNKKTSRRKRDIKV